MYKFSATPSCLFCLNLKVCKSFALRFLVFCRYVLCIQTVLYSETDFLTALSWCGLLLSSAYFIYTKVKNFPWTTLFFSRASHEEKKKKHTGSKENSHLLWFHKGNITVQWIVLLVLHYAQIFDLLHKMLVLNLCLNSDQLSVNIEQIQIVFLWVVSFSDFFLNES